MSSPGDDTSVQVALRIRPQNAAEKIDMCHMCTSVTPGHPQVVMGKDKAFTYDFVFDIDSVQSEIYHDIARPLIEGCFEGYNATILAYGQTGSGKTYTMGTSFDVGVHEDVMGIIPRAAMHLFEGIEMRRAKAEEDGRPLPDIKVTAQFLELYNEEMIDLLDIENKGKKQIKVHEDHNGCIYLSGVVSRNVSSAQDCMNILEDGAISRTTAATNMNATSSRSHAIFTVFVKHHRVAKAEGEGEADEFETLNAKFNFVDLAGSERLKRTGATGDRAKEGISINQGLLSLGNVISALGDKTKRGTHVPYRDSKLTRLLQDSLGGNSKTLMIACISPSDRDFMETLNSLKYANRARNIKNKVVINQDKASKQIAMLRQEIQQLTLELLEYKQGKRAATDGNEYMTDTYQELEMLRTDNENLRMRIKAMQSSIDTQTIQLTELKVSTALAHLSDDDKPVMEEIIKRYEKEIQELKNKLNESEAMSSVAMRRADNVSRLAMSPGTFIEEDTSFSSVINAAKEDVKKERKLKKILSKKSRPAHSVSESDDTVVNMETSEKDNASENEVEETLVDKSEVDEDIEEEEEDEMDEEEDENESNTDSDSDDELNMSLKEEEALQDNINDLNTDITIKQKLIDELEHSQQRLTALKHQYDQKLNLLHNKIKETEEERDKVLKSIGSVDAVANQKANEVKKRYEKKLVSMQKELSKLQNARREHQRLIKTKEDNERQLKLLRNELGDMKKMKVKLMRSVRDEITRNKMKESKMNRQMESALKENLKKDIALKRMKNEKKQKDLIMKRKQEELNALRRLVKPVSGNVTVRRGTRNRPNKLQLQYQSNSSDSNATFVVDERSNIPTPTTPTSIKTGSPRVSRSPAVSKRAKQKWESLDRKITEITIRLKNVTQMESDMERWLSDRERVSKQLEAATKRKEEVEKSQDENTIKEVANQLEGLEAHMEYIQENIAQSQGTIIGLEDGDDSVNPSDLIRGCTLVETKYILEHFYSKSIETAQELANKDAAQKEIQIKLEAMTKHCEVQQQLLQHACNFGTGILPPEQMEAQTFDEMQEDKSYVESRKARRKTAIPEDLLHPKETKTKLAPIDINFEDSDTSPQVSQENASLAQSFQLDEKVIKKLADLEKNMKDRKMMPPPDLPGSDDQPQGRRSGSFTGQIESNNEGKNLSFTRNTKATSSARLLRKATSASNLKGRRSNPSSAKTSPVMERKNLDETSLSTSSDFDSKDVFKRLTSSLPQEGDPDLGQILPSKATVGKPDGLVCMYTATGHNNAVLSLDVLNELMVTGSKDRTAKVWDMNTSEEILSLSGHKRDVSVVKFSPLGDMVFTVNQATVKIWDLRSGAVVKSLSLAQNPMSEIMDVSSNKDGSVLYTAVGNIVKRTDLRSYSNLGKLSGHSGAVTCMIVTDTSHEHDIVITGSKDHSIKIFEVIDDASSQIPRHTLEPPHYDGIQSLAMKEKFIFSGSRDNTIKKWNFANHALEQHLTSAHRDWVTALNFVPGLEALVSGDRKGLLRLWDVNSCKPIGEIQGHGKSINSIKCNNSCIFSASSDRLVRIWKPSHTLEDQLLALDSN